MKKLLVIALVLGLTVAVYAADQWDWKAGKTALWDKSDRKCVQKVLELGKEMKDAGVEFQVALGKYGTERNASMQNMTYVPGNYGHCWIVYRNRIIDPSQLNDGSYMYTEEQRMSYARFVEMFG